MTTSKQLFIFVAMIISSVAGFAQNREFEAVKNSGDYIWGLGMSEDYDEAVKNALDDLIGKISVHVESSFENVEVEKNMDFKAYTKSVIKTYSSVSLTNTRQLTYENDGMVYILKYIKASNLKEIFDYRENKIMDYLAMGSKAQREYRIGDALRYYYWSYALWLSHPYRDKIEVDDEGSQILAGVLLDSRLNALLSNLDIHVVDKLKYPDNDKTKLILSCTYNGHKVVNLDFKYFTGQTNSTMQEIENGVSEIYLYGAEQDALDKLTLSIEYRYLNKSYQDRELSSVLNTVKVPFYKRSRKTVDVNVAAEKADPKKLIRPEFEPVNNLNDSKNYYEKVIRDLLMAIADKDYEKAGTYFTPGGKQMFEKLLQYGQASVLPLKDTLKVIRLNDEVVVRSVPMSFYFPGSRRYFMENVVFTFNKGKKIDAVSFAVSDQTIFDIVNHGNSFGNIKDKFMLIQFMEYYKTAYSLKRLDYIESIFSEDALIIVGKVLQRSNRIDDMYRIIGEKAVRYQQYTKKQYIENLKRSFNSKEYINIDFDETTIKKMNGSRKIYGIQIAQNYYSSNYNDFGYLFLMIDLSDSLRPKIYVRTWQPEKKSDGSIYGLDDFKIN